MFSARSPIMHAPVQQDAKARSLRAIERRSRLVAHRAANHEEAEKWDLSFWQSKTPQERLSALVAIRQDIEVVNLSRQIHEQHR
jgi:hypothetical protein